MSDNNQSEEEFTSEQIKRKFLFDELNTLQLRICENVRYRCGQFIQDDRIQNFIFLCIVLNTVAMGIGATDLAYDYNNVQNILAVIDRVFLCIFTLESGLQLFFRSWRLFKSGWLTFDFTVVFLSWSLSNFQVIRGFRIVRAVRLMMHVAAIRDLIEAIGSVMSNLSGLLLLSSLIIYIFAVLFTQLFKDVALENFEYDYFSRLDKTLFSLLQFMTLDFADAMRETMAVYSMAWIPFVLFILVMGFVVYNLIAAMVCDAVAVLGAREQKKKAEKLKSEKEIAQEHTDQEKLALLSHQVQVLLKSQQLNHGLLQELFEKLSQHGSNNDYQNFQSIEEIGNASEPNLEPLTRMVEDPSSLSLNNFQSSKRFYYDD